MQEGPLYVIPLNLFFFLLPNIFHKSTEPAFVDQPNADPLFVTEIDWLASGAQMLNK